MTGINWLLPIFASYLLGGIPFGLIVPRLFGVSDIRTMGSGNIGATNVWRVVGFRAAIWVFVGDIAKGAVAVLMVRWYIGNFGITGLSLDGLLLICALAAVLGHVFPVYLKFRGGKGVNTALGSMLALLPVEALISVAFFMIIVIISKYVSLGSMIGAVVFFVCIAIERFFQLRDVAMIYVWVSAAVAVLIIITHHQNISRLLSGTENKLSLSGGSGRSSDGV